MRNEYSLPQILNPCLLKCFWGSFVNSTQNSSENSKPFWILRFGRGSVVRPPSNGERLRDIQYSMSMVVDTRFHTWFIMTVYYKMQKIILQNATAILLQNATEVYYKMRQVFYYKMRHFYYKMRQFYYQLRQFYYKIRQLLENATFITSCGST